VQNSLQFYLQNSSSALLQCRTKLIQRSKKFRRRFAYRLRVSRSDFTSSRLLHDIKLIRRRISRLSNKFALRQICVLACPTSSDDTLGTEDRSGVSWSLHIREAKEKFGDDDGRRKTRDGSVGEGNPVFVRRASCLREYIRSAQTRVRACARAPRKSNYERASSARMREILKIYGAARAKC
jgi:hypothetical protein